MPSSANGEIPRNTARQAPSGTHAIRNPLSHPAARLLALLLITLITTTAWPADRFDTVLKDGQIVDGKITQIGPVESAAPTGQSDPRLAGFDRMIHDFMKKHHVPGCALAVTDHGRLVHARGYGHADVATRQKVTPTSLFRIASISKPITAVAVLQLVQRNQLCLDVKVFEILEHEPLPDQETKPDERLNSITVRHLLQHRGGWDRDKSFDPMFRSVQFAHALGTVPPAGPDDVIRCMMTQPLDFDPGQGYAYSNFGYCLLGRVIEAVTGQSYEDYVTQEVLGPLGIRSMRIGKTRLEGRAQREVRYYDPGKGPSVFAEDLNQEVPRPYGAWHLEAMDAHGGWIASAVDLARFAAAFDDPRHCKLLGQETIQTMFARPDGPAGYDPSGKPKETYYSCGWMNRPIAKNRTNHWHAGSLPGTSTILVRRHDGRNWVLLFNARTSPHVSRLTQAADRLVHQAADEVQEWPEHDLFDDFYTARGQD